MPRKHLLAVILYSLLAVVMTWPLILNFGTVIPGVEGDAASYVWALGWARTALANGFSPFHTDFVFYPLGGATQLLWAVSLIGFLSIPLQALIGLVAAHNLLYLGATVLTAYGTFLLAEDILREASRAGQSREFDARPLPPFAMFLVTQFVIQNRKRAGRSFLAPFAAGVVFAFAPLRLGYGLSFLNLFNTEFIPFYLLFLMRATRQRSWRMAVLAGIFLGLNAYIDFQIAAFLILLTILYAAYTLAGRVDNPLRVMASWSLVALVSLLVAAPMLAAVADDLTIEGGNYIRVYPLEYSAARSYDLLSFVVPNARSTLYADAPLKIANVNAAVRSEDESALSPDRQPFVGYVVLALAVYAVLRRWRTARFWLLIALVFALFSLGPTLHVAGQPTGIPLPFLVLHEIPIVNHIRIPMRYGIVVSLALALLAGIAINNIQVAIDNAKSRIRTLDVSSVPLRRALGLRVAELSLWLVPVAVLFEYAVLPYPIQPLTVPRIYDEIARVPGNLTVLEIPTFNWRGAAATEVYQAVHGKRILRAYTNRIAPGPAEYLAFRGIPIVVRSLRVLEGAEKGDLAPEDIAEDKRVRDEVVRFFDLRYAIVHRQWLKPDQVVKIDAYLHDVLQARPVFDDGETLAYDLPGAATVPDETRIDLNTNIGQMYAGRGWQFEYPPANWDGKFNFVWASGARSEVYFVASQPANLTMVLHAHAESLQRVSVSLNGQRAAEIELTPEWKDYAVSLPARAVVSGMNRIELVYGAELKETIGMTTISIQRGQHGAETNR